MSELSVPPGPAGSLGQGVLNVAVLGVVHVAGPLRHARGDDRPAAPPRRCGSTPRSSRCRARRSDSASSTDSHMPGPPRCSVSISRSSWYSEWIDHFECGREVAQDDRVGPDLLQIRIVLRHVQRRPEGGQLLAVLRHPVVVEEEVRRPVSVCQGLCRSTLMVNAEYVRSPDSSPDHSGLVSVCCGRPARRSSGCGCRARRRPGRPAGSPTRCSSCSEPSVCQRPLVAPDRASIASATCGARREARPSVARLRR